MLKYIQYLIFLALLISTKSYDSKCKGYASTVDECIDLLYEYEKDAGDRCCLFSGKEKGESTLIKQCTVVDEEGYRNINDFKAAQFGYRYEDVKLECKSHYLYLPILYLLIILIYVIILNNFSILYKFY